MENPNRRSSTLSSRDDTNDSDVSIPIDRNLEVILCQPDANGYYHSHGLLVKELVLAPRSLEPRNFVWILLSRLYFGVIWHIYQRGQLLKAEMLSSRQTHLTARLLESISFYDITIPTRMLSNMKFDFSPQLKNEHNLVAPNAFSTLHVSATPTSSDSTRSRQSWLHQCYNKVPSVRVFTNYLWLFHLRETLIRNSPSPMDVILSYLLTGSPSTRDSDLGSGVEPIRVIHFLLDNPIFNGDIPYTLAELVSILNSMDPDDLPPPFDLNNIDLQNQEDDQPPWFEPLPTAEWIRRLQRFTISEDSIPTSNLTLNLIDSSSTDCQRHVNRTERSEPLTSENPTNGILNPELWLAALFL